MDFEALIAEAGFTHESAAKYLGITLRTLYRYFAAGAPLMARRAIAARSGQLDGWQGYRIHGNRMIRADGRVFTRKDLDHYEHWVAKPDLVGLAYRLAGEGAPDSVGVVSRIAELLDLVAEPVTPPLTLTRDKKCVVASV